MDKTKLLTFDEIIEILQDTTKSEYRYKELTIIEVVSLLTYFFQSQLNKLINKLCNEFDEIKDKLKKLEKREE